EVVDEKNADESTAMHSLCHAAPEADWRCLKEGIDVLLQSGADPSKRDKHGRTSVDLLLDALEPLVSQGEDAQIAAGVEEMKKILLALLDHSTTTDILSDRSERLQPLSILFAIR